MICTMTSKRKFPIAKKPNQPRRNRKIKQTQRSFELQIANLNRKLSKLRSMNKELMIQTQALTRTNISLSENSSVMQRYAWHLTEETNQKMVRYYEMEAELDTDQLIKANEFKRLFEESEHKNKAMQESHAVEVKHLQMKLTSLEELHRTTNSFMMRYEGEKEQSEDRETSYKQVISDLEQKLAQDKDEMKQEMERRLIQLADDFHDAANTCMHTVMHRTIRENIAVHNSLDELQEKYRALEIKQTETEEASKNFDMETKLHEEEKYQLLHKSTVQKNLIDNLTDKYEKAQRNLKNYDDAKMNLDTVRIELSKSLTREQTLTTKLKTMEQKTKARECDYASVREDLNREQCDNVKFINILRRATYIAKKLQKLQNQISEGGSYYGIHTKRQELLDYLTHLFIFSNDISNMRVPSLDTLGDGSDTYINTYNEYDKSNNVLEENSTGSEEYNEISAGIDIEPITETGETENGTQDAIVLPDESVIKSEDEIIEEIIVQEESDFSSINSHDFSKPQDYQDGFFVVADRKDRVIASDENDTTPSSSSEAIIYQHENTVNFFQSNQETEIQLNQHSQLTNILRKPITARKSDSNQEQKLDIFSQIPYFDKDIRAKRLSMKEDKDKRTSVHRKPRRVLLPPLVDPRTGQNRTFSDIRKTSFNTEYKPISNAWYNVPDRTVIVDTNNVSRKSQSAGIKKYSRLGNNVSNVTFVLEPDAINNNAPDNIKEIDHTQYDKKLGSNCETANNAGTLSRKHRTHETNFMTDVPSDTYYY